MENFFVFIFDETLTLDIIIIPCLYKKEWLFFQAIPLQHLYDYSEQHNAVECLKTIQGT